MTPRPDLETDLDLDQPGDNTVRPCRPERRAALEAEREKLRRWGGLNAGSSDESPAKEAGDHAS
jgi:hypothetical protein